MPERTDAEWKALADRIAREVMGLIPDEFFDDGTSVWWVSDNGERHFLIVGFADQPELESRYTEWQPHNDVAQALAVLDRIAETYHYGHSIFLLASHLTHYRVLIWKGFGCVGMWQGEHTSRAKAICLAIEKFMEESC